MAKQTNIRDTMLESVETMADDISIDRTSKLTDMEREVLKSLPKNILRKVEKTLAQYTPTNSKYDIRRELVLKAIAQMAMNAKTMYQAYQLGSDAGENTNG